MAHSAIVVNCDRIISFLLLFSLKIGGIFIVEKSVENGIYIINNNDYKQLVMTLDYIQDLIEKNLDEIITAKEVLNNSSCVKPIKATSN